MPTPVDVAVPRKGRPLEAVLERLAERAGDAPAGRRDGPPVAALADDVISTLRYEKAIAKDDQTADGTVYDRLAAYSDLQTRYRPEYTLLRDDRAGRPRRIVFDAMTLYIDGRPIRLVGREEPFRAVRTHEVPLAFDSADLVLEEVVELRPEPLASIEEVNDRIDPRETDVRVAAGLGDTVHHTLLGTPDIRSAPTDEGSPPPLDREFVAAYEGPLCVSPRYERLVTAVLGGDATEGVEFVHPPNGRPEEAAIADTGLGVYLTVTGATARDHGLDLGERLFPSETVLLENVAERDDRTAGVRELIIGDGLETTLAVP